VGECAFFFIANERFCAFFTNGIDPPLFFTAGIADVFLNLSTPPPFKKRIIMHKFAKYFGILFWNVQTHGVVFIIKTLFQ